MTLYGELYPDLLEKNYNLLYKNMTDKEKSVDLNRLNKKITDIENEKEELMSSRKQLYIEKKELDNERKIIEQKLKELESKARKEGVLQTVANLITNIKSRIEQTKAKANTSQNHIEEKERKIKEIETEIVNIHKEIEKKKSEIDKILKLKKELGKEESKIAKTIFSELKRLDEQKITFVDIRQELINKVVEPKMKEYYSYLFNLGIINEELVKQTKKEREAVDRDLKDFADITHGFVGADLAALAKEAAMSLLRKNLYKLKALKEDEPIPQEMLDQFEITKEDFIDALKTVRPSALREVLIEVPNIKWSDIGGLDDVKQEIIEAVEWPLKYPQAFKKVGITPPKGILIYGPPGTGKTLLAKAVANESQANFIVVKGPELLSKWVGESERGVRKIFEKARQASPTIIFFDEIDAIAPNRSSSSDNHSTEKVVNQLLTEIDGLVEMHDVVVIGATNRPDILDTALLRPGRFDRIILAGVPDEKNRLKIFEIHTKNMPLDKDVDLSELSKKTEGYVGADIQAICREAAIFTLRKEELVKDKEVRDDIKIQMSSFEEALKKVRPSVSRDVEEMYKTMKDQFSAAKSKEMLKDKPNYYG